MTPDALFCSLSPDRIADLVRRAQHAVCYAAPGIQLDLAQAMVETAGRLGKEMLTVSLDFDDRVMRMGYGDIGAVTLLLDAGILVNSSPGLRTALVVVDNEGYDLPHQPGGVVAGAGPLQRAAAQRGDRVIELGPVVGDLGVSSAGQGCGAGQQRQACRHDSYQSFSHVAPVVSA
jgi:hypothetical protein